MAVYIDHECVKRHAKTADVDKSTGREKPQEEHNIDIAIPACLWNSYYIGEYLASQRNGWGFYHWSADESYEGTFFFDKLHGYGLYSWPNGSFYFGTFYLDKRSGYGIIGHSDGSIFEGFINADQPEGPGLLLPPSREIGQADVGYWCSGRLSRILTPVGNSKKGFSYTQEFPEYSVYLRFRTVEFSRPADPVASSEKSREESFEDADDEVEASGYFKMLTESTLDSLHVWDPRSLLYQKKMASMAFRCLLQCSPPTSPEWTEKWTKELRQRVASRPGSLEAVIASLMELSLEPIFLAQLDSCLDRQGSTTTFRADEVDKNSLLTSAEQAFKDIVTANIVETKYRVKRSSYLQPFIRQKYANWCYKRPERDTEQLQKDKDAWNSRSGHPTLTPWNLVWWEHTRRTGEIPCPGGPTTQEANDFLNNCYKGNMKAVKSQLLGETEPVMNFQAQLDPNVADSVGCTGLFWAALHLNFDLVNLLLDFGANINQLTDEGLSPLSICLLHYYRLREQANHLDDRLSPVSDSLDHRDEVIPVESEEVDCTCLQAVLPIQCRRRLIGKKFFFRCEVSVTLPTVSSVGETKKLREARLAQLRRTCLSQGHSDYSEVNHLTEDKHTSFTDRSMRSPDVGLFGIPACKNLPTFQRFTDCLTRSRESPEQEEAPIKSSGRVSTRGGLNCNGREEALNNRKTTKGQCGQAAGGNTESVPKYSLPAFNTLPKQAQAKGSEGEQNTVNASPKPTEEGNVKKLGKILARCEQVQKMISLLLHRGADASVAYGPLPCIFIAVQFADVVMVRKLINSRAKVNLQLTSLSTSGHGRLPELDNLQSCDQSDHVNQFTSVSGEPLVLRMNGLSPLHYAAVLPGSAGVEVCQQLLESGGHPNAAAEPDDSFKIPTQTQEPAPASQTETCEGQPRNSKPSQGGRTPLHLVCAREYDSENAADILRLMLKYGGDPNLTCNGHSALSLAIASGNDQCVKVLISHPGTRVNQVLSQELGTALCVATVRAFEFRRSAEERFEVITQLLEVGKAAVHQRIPLPKKNILGNIIDFTYEDYMQDGRVSKIPFHALNNLEKEAYLIRAQIMELLAEHMRAVCRLHQRILLENESDGKRNVLPDQSSRSSRSPTRQKTPVKTGANIVSGGKTDIFKRFPGYKFCYECGRSVAVHLSACTRCRRVYFCSKACRLKSWNLRHREECWQKVHRSHSRENKTVQMKAEHTKCKRLPELDTFHFTNTWLCRAAGGEFLTDNHPAHQYRFINNRYVRINQSGRLFVAVADEDGNYSLV